MTIIWLSAKVWNSDLKVAISLCRFDKSSTWASRSWFPIWSLNPTIHSYRSLLNHSILVIILGFSRSSDASNVINTHGLIWPKNLANWASVCVYLLIDSSFLSTNCYKNFFDNITISRTYRRGANIKVEVGVVVPIVPSQHIIEEGSTYWIPVSTSPPSIGLSTYSSKIEVHSNWVVPEDIEGCALYGAMRLASPLIIPILVVQVASTLW